MRRARGIKLASVLAVGAMALTACGGGTTGTAGGGSSTTSVKVGLAFDVGGRGDKSFNDLAAAGLDKAKTDLKITTKELSAVVGESDAAKAARLKLLAQAGFNPIIAVGFAYAPGLKEVAPQFPKVKFAIVDGAASDVSGPNVTNLVFKENESSFLVGVAAAKATKTKNVGFIGGVQTPLIQKFQAGYQAGVAAVDKTIKVQVKYLSQPPDFTGFNDPAKAKVTAQGMYDGGADVVYHAAGGSGSGLFEAAAASKKWAIGVDSDQYATATADQKQWILTSALKGVDTAVFNFVEQAGKNQVKSGEQRFGLKENGVGYSTSNPAVKQYESVIDGFKTQIIDGKIVVPATPAS
ncbi:BMP family lipoprotein [Fodinicola feengrottensis]|uniref:BMP family ABC transporter substrate-binding protein n=1 Tax=Fodinicola feengrottensis TaxID=435914 RepID=A0ABN2HE01_9ACTN|nr:BMP family ABC transporter substrate-binding protein [Fodinicola feengrottensis]